MNVQNIVVTGKSGAGKQPRIDVLVEEFGLKQLSTGSIFREYLGAFKKVREGSKISHLWSDEDGFAPDKEIMRALKRRCIEEDVLLCVAMLGYKAARYVDSGHFVPDHITNELFGSAFRASKGTGMVFDGYPRTAEQSEVLLGLLKTAGTKVDLIVQVDNEDDAIIERTVGRRICPSCKKVYHTQYKPAPEGLCACGTAVIQRSDDTVEKITSRLQEFQDKAIPAIETLTGAGIPLVHVPGNLPVFTNEIVKESVLSVVMPALEG